MFSAVHAVISDGSSSTHTQHHNYLTVPPLPNWAAIALYRSSLPALLV